jgi:hypothetical protein
MKALEPTDRFTRFVRAMTYLFSTKPRQVLKHQARRAQRRAKRIRWAENPRSAEARRRRRRHMAQASRRVNARLGHHPKSGHR